MWAALQQSACMQRQRRHLLASLDALCTVEGVAQAQAALSGMLSTGRVAVDYAGAIDVLEVLQGVLDNEQLLGLACFR